jgi:hypothetical protein
MQFLEAGGIARNILGKFCFPKIGASLWRGRPRASLMAMPEAAVDKNRLRQAWKH